MNDWLKRCWIYFNEVFHPGSRFLYSFCISFIAFIFIDSDVSNIEPKTFIIGSMTTFFIILYYRLCDEFKDRATDEKYFPDRPLPSGRVRYSDLNTVIYIIIPSMIVMNIFFMHSFYEFLALLVFAYLMGKWFFLEKLISNNRILAFLTHSPISLVSNLYVIAIVAPNGFEVYSLKSLYIVLALTLPGYLWEILRKTFYYTEEREGYQTYSILLGYRGSLFAAIFFAVLQMLVVCLMTEVFTFSLVGEVIAQLTSILIILYLVFLMITKKESKVKLQVLAEVYGLVILVGLITGRLL